MTRTLKRFSHRHRRPVIPVTGPELQTNAISATPADPAATSTSFGKPAWPARQIRAFQARPRNGTAGGFAVRPRVAGILLAADLDFRRRAACASFEEFRRSRPAQPHATSSSSGLHAILFARGDTTECWVEPMQQIACRRSSVLVVVAHEVLLLPVSMGQGPRPAAPPARARALRAARAGRGDILQQATGHVLFRNARRAPDGPADG